MHFASAIACAITLLASAAAESQAAALEARAASESRATPPESRAASEARAAQESRLAGQPAPDFALKSLEGVNLRLSESLGQVVLVNFWAPWSGPSRQEMPELNKLYATYRSAGLVLLGVSVAEDTVRTGEFARTLKIAYPVLLDARKAVAAAYDLETLPMTVLIDRAGTVRYVHRDYKPGFERRYIEELRTLLDE